MGYAGLFVDAGDDGAGVAIEAVESVVVSDALHGAADDLLKIDVGFGGDFSGDDDQAGGGKRFAGDALKESSARQASRMASEICRRSYRDGLRLRIRK